VKLREAGWIVSVAVIIAVAVNTDGRREALGLAVCASGAEPFWTDRSGLGPRSILRRLTRAARAIARRCSFCPATHARVADQSE
jgi:putative transposase